MTGAPNFLEEEDYEAPTHQEPAGTLLAPAESTAPKFGEPGFNKGKPNRRKGTPRARVTERDLPILYFLGHFPGADVEACSMLANAEETTIGNAKVGGGLTSIATTQNRLAKLIRLRVAKKERHPISGKYHYGLTEEGLELAKEIGLDMRGARIFDGIARARLGHYRAIALVAAKFASPAGFFRRSGVEPVPLEQLISEGRMRSAFAPAQRELKELRAAGRKDRFADWRADKLKEALEAVEKGTLPASQLIDAYPVLLTLGTPSTVASKSAKQPDLVVNLDQARQGSTDARNLLVEVELSVKDRTEYERIMATLAAELATGNVYRRALYFTTGTQVANILKQIDAANGYKLFEQKKLVVGSLTDRNGTPIAPKKRSIVGGN